MESADPAPEPGPGQVRVRVAWCGLCGTDLHEYRSGPFYIPVEPHPVTGRSAPIILGHEISGWVESAGPGAGLSPGALVGLNALLPCGSCPACARGSVHLCLTIGHLGLSADGGLADLVTVPAAMAVPAPSGMDSAVAALGEPFAVAMHAVRQGGRPHGTDCVVVGAGTIGLAVAMLLHADGNHVVITDVSRSRLRRAAALGFVTGGPESRAPVVFECAGAAGAPAAAFGMAEPGGLVVLTGLPESPSTLDITVVVLREVRVVGSVSHLADADLAPALDFLARHGDQAAELITGRVPLEAAVCDGLEVLAGPGGADHVKILVRVGL